MVFPSNRSRPIDSKEKKGGKKRRGKNYTFHRRLSSLVQHNPQISFLDHTRVQFYCLARLSSPLFLCNGVCKINSALLIYITPSLHSPLLFLPSFPSFHPGCLPTRPPIPTKADVYDRVIDDVLENMRSSFQDEGVDLGVLTDLKRVIIYTLPISLSTVLRSTLNPPARHDCARTPHPNATVHACLFT